MLSTICRAMRSFLQRHPVGRLFGRQALRRLGAGCHGSGGTACHGGMEGRGLACLGSLYGNGKLYIKLIAKLCKLFYNIHM